MSKEYNRRFFADVPVAHEPPSVKVEAPVGPTAKPHPKEYLRRTEAPIVQTTEDVFSDLANAAGPAIQLKPETQPGVR